MFSLGTYLRIAEFYELMNQMDVCVPAFAEFGYYRMQASSTFAMAVECNVHDLILLYKQLIQCSRLRFQS
jgi:hypothetical protein